MHAEQSGRVVIDESDLWRPVEERSRSLETEERSGLRRRRWSAAVVDSLLLMAPLGIVTALVGVGGDVIAIALWLTYDFLCEALTGQTLGKALFGLRVVRKDGAPLNLAAVATRNVLRLVDWSIGWIFVLATRGRQRLGDVVAGTVVAGAEGRGHIPATERFRTSVLIGYPVCWIGAAVAACVLAASQAESDRYLQLANTTCARMGAVIAAHPETGVAEYHRMVADLEISLRALEPPAGERAGHDRLVTILHRERALLGRATRADGPERRRIARDFRALVSRDAPTLRADGYPACA